MVLFGLKMLSLPNQANVVRRNVFDMIRNTKSTYILNGTSLSQQQEKIGTGKRYMAWFSKGNPKKETKIREKASRHETEIQRTAAQKYTTPDQLLPHLAPAPDVSYTIDLGRHTKVTASGRIFSFSALVIIGNCNGVAGIGYGKGDSIPTAVATAERDAAKNLVTIYRYQERTIPYSIQAKYRASAVSMYATTRGSGVKGMHAVRQLCNAFGLTDISMKVRRSRNKRHVLYAVMRAVVQITPPEILAKQMGKKFIDLNKYWHPSKDRQLIDQI